MRDTILTYTGKYVNPITMRAGDGLIDINDIAHSLANQCRFNGHTEGYYSVARHSVLVAQYIDRKHSDKALSLTALLHDASEAYLCDIPRPLKHQTLMRGYRAAEERLQAEILSEFNAPAMNDLIHEADNEILNIELNYGRYHFDSTPKEDKETFLKHFHLYTNSKFD